MLYTAAVFYDYGEASIVFLSILGQAALKSKYIHIFRAKIHEDVMEKAVQ